MTYRRKAVFILLGAVGLALVVPGLWAFVASIRLFIELGAR